jgi:hypothetical protein
MSLKFNLKTNIKIKIDGKEYSSPEEMPPELRQKYEAALAKRNLSSNVSTKTTITFNGQSYTSLDEMPEEIRQIYSSVLSAVDKDHDGIPDALQPGEMIGSTPLVQPALSSRPGTVEPGNSYRPLLATLIAVGILAAILLIVITLVLARR